MPIAFGGRYTLICPALSVRVTYLCTKCVRPEKKIMIVVSDHCNMPYCREEGLTDSTNTTVDSHRVSLPWVAPEVRKSGIIRFVE